MRQTVPGPGLTVLDFAQGGSYIACPMPRFARFAWAVLVYDLAVVAWGAYKSGRDGLGRAGCGAHWPLCNGELVPRSPPVAMLVELSHRVTSGLALVLSLVPLVWALKAYPRDHVVRRGAFASAAFMASEALIGAGLVLFGLVAHDESAKRAVSLCLHLTNTFLLLGSTALTAWWASSESSDGAWGTPAAKQGQRAIAWTMGVPLVAMVLVGASGAVTALGDTLYRPASLAAGLAQDLAPGANVFIRLRAVHPMLAASTGGVILLACAKPSRGRCAHPRPCRVLSYTASALVVAQVGVGLVDVATLAAGRPCSSCTSSSRMRVWIARLVLLTAASLRASLSAPAAQTGRPPSLPIPSLSTCAGGPLGVDPTGLHRPHAIRELRREAHLVGREHHRQSARRARASAGTSRTSSRMSGSRALVGSSRSSTRSGMASARAMATRCFCPPDSWCG